ncbi:MAG: hypothetical protein E6R03_13285 [Hyphomicrobiaceae bacterium]|nr:MAG: hypothetical protein E6R03_13285 [Hyphomicrobiaceae bacterium]
MKVTRNTAPAKGTTESFVNALASTTNGRKVRNHGPAFRGGWTEVAIGKTDLTLPDLKRAVRKALKLSGCKAQPNGLFCTRNLNPKAAIQFYVSGADWCAVIDLAGTQNSARLNVSFSSY